MATVTVSVLMALLWIFCTATLQRDELLLGVGVVVLSTVFSLALARQYENPLRFRWKDVLQVWRAPFYVITQMWGITVLLIKDLLGKRVGSYYRICRFEGAATGGVSNARRVLATSYTTIAPNFIVIGIDVERKQMLFHQIERTAVPQMTKSLGARP